MTVCLCKKKKKSERLPSYSCQFFFWQGNSSDRDVASAERRRKSGTFHREDPTSNNSSKHGAARADSPRQKDQKIYTRRKEEKRGRSLPKRRKLLRELLLAIFPRRKRLFLQSWYSKDTFHIALECVKLRMRLGPAMSFSWTE